LVSIKITGSGARIAYLSSRQQRVDLQLANGADTVAVVGSRVTPLGDVVTLIGNPVALAF
jgi:hypothetical protein